MHKKIKNNQKVLIKLDNFPYQEYGMLEGKIQSMSTVTDKEGNYFIEIQLRTIVMDSWASLEHQMKYKHDIKDPKRIVRELKRCADELASCDLSMQTIRNLIQENVRGEES